MGHMPLEPASGSSQRRPARPNRVVLKIEYVSDREGKLFMAARYVVMAMALGLLVWGLTAKFRKVRAWIGLFALRAVGGAGVPVRTD